ncbi:MAG: hypothetical protein ACRCYQ_09625 [Nocardioides sp.]
MWWFLLFIVAAVVIYRFRVPILAKVLGQPESRINRRLGKGD